MWMERAGRRIVKCVTYHTLQDRFIGWWKKTTEQKRITNLRNIVVKRILKRVVALTFLTWYEDSKERMEKERKGAVCRVKMTLDEIYLSLSPYPRKYGRSPRSPPATAGGLCVSQSLV
jgi:hypothetical protein